jgi:aminopeptidase N
MRFHFYHFLGFLFLSSSIVSAQDHMRSYLPDPYSQAREHNIDVERMALDVRFKPEQGLVIGNVTHFFQPIQENVDSIILDGPDIHYQQVRLDGQEVKYRKTTDGIVIYPAQTLHWNSAHQVNIVYEALPKKGIYFIGWNDSTNRSRKQIWTQGEEVDNRYWIPAYDAPDDKLITELTITTEKDFNVLSNGTKLGEKTNKDGTKTWHYRMTHPHTFYLTMIGAGKYDVYKTKSAGGVPMYEWYYPDQQEKREPTYRYTERIMDFLESETGVKFPWESYSQIPVQEFIYGAMENTTATIFGDFYCVDKREFLDRNYVMVNAHEMTHQWFGDFVSARSPLDQWLQESFATHYAKLFNKSLYGDDFYQWDRHNEAATAIAASKENQNPIVYTGAGSARIYQKGSFVLDMMKYVIGRDEYNKTVKAYLNKFAYSNVTSYDFESSFQDVLGRNMNWFFEEWLYHGGEPHYQVRYENLTDAKGKYTQIYIDQVQKTNDVVGYFKMPIVVEVHYKDGTVASQKEWVESEHHSMHIANAGGKEVEFVLFDPGNNVLKSLTFNRSFEELSAQLQKATNMIDRYDALAAMRSTSLDQKRAVLQQVYAKEKFHAMKEEILYQLANDAQSHQIFIQAAKDPEASVRMAAIKNTVIVPEELRTAMESLLTDSSYNVIEETLPKMVASFPDKRDQYLAKTDKQYGMSMNVRIAWLKLAILNNPDNRAYTDELVDYCTPAFEFRTRINAMQALQQLNFLNTKAINSLFDASTSRNGRLARPAQETIAYFSKQTKYKAEMVKTIYHSRWTKEQQDMLLKLL